MPDSGTDDLTAQQQLDLAAAFERLAGKISEAGQREVEDALVDLTRTTRRLSSEFRAEGGMSLLRRPSLERVLSTARPRKLPRDVLAEAFLEGAHLIWSMTSLIEIKRAVDEGHKMDGTPAREP